MISATPLPQDASDYGDFDESMKAELVKRQENSDEAPEDDDPIGDLFADIFAGTGALLSEGIKIVTNVADGSVKIHPVL